MGKFLYVVGFRLLWSLIAMLVVSLVYSPIQLAPPKQAVLEISGLNPGEQIIISKMEWWSERKETADEKGIATFVDIPLGNWQVVKGGSEGLHKLFIPVREYPPELRIESVRVTYGEKTQQPKPRPGRRYI